MKRHLYALLLVLLGAHMAFAEPLSNPAAEQRRQQILQSIHDVNPAPTDFEPELDHVDRARMLSDMGQATGEHVEYLQQAKDQAQISVTQFSGLATAATAAHDYATAAMYFSAIGEMNQRGGVELAASINEYKRVKRLDDGGALYLKQPPDATTNRNPLPDAADQKAFANGVTDNTQSVNAGAAPPIALTPDLQKLLASRGISPDEFGKLLNVGDPGAIPSLMTKLGATTAISYADVQKGKALADRKLSDIMGAKGSGAADGDAKSPVAGAGSATASTSGAAAEGGATLLMPSAMTIAQAAAEKDAARRGREGQGGAAGAAADDGGQLIAGDGGLSSAPGKIGAAFKSFQEHWHHPEANPFYYFWLMLGVSQPRYQLNIFHIAHREYAKWRGSRRHRLALAVE